MNFLEHLEICAKKRSNLLARLALEDVCIHWLHTTRLPYRDQSSEFKKSKDGTSEEAVPFAK